MARSLQTCTFAVSAALMVFAVFSLQADPSANSAGRLLPPLPRASLVAAAQLADAGAGAFIEIDGDASEVRPCVRDHLGREFALPGRTREGRWVCGPLPPGVWRVAFGGGDGERRELELTLAPGERRRLRP